MGGWARRWPRPDLPPGRSLSSTGANEQPRKRASTDPLLARQWDRTRRSPIHARDATTMSTLTTRLAHRTHAARAAGALAGALLLIAVLASGVVGASPERLATQITDDVGALGGSTGTVQPALDNLQRAANVQLWVWFTDTTGSLSTADCATETAKLSSFGGNDLL